MILVFSFKSLKSTEVNTSHSYTWRCSADEQHHKNGKKFRENASFECLYHNSK